MPPEERQALGRRGGLLLLRGAALALMPPAILLLCQAVSLQSFSAAWAWVGSRPAALGLTWLLLGFAALILYGLLRLLSLTWLLTAAVPLALTFVSYYKEAVNGLPLMLTDFSLAGEVLTVAGYARLDLSAPSALALVLLLAAAGGLLLLDRRPGRLSFRRGALLSGALILLLEALFPLLGLGAALAAGYRDYPTQQERNDALSVPLSLLSTWAGAEPSGSTEYSQLRMERLLGEMEADVVPGSGVRPHIIYVMSESFFDITDLPEVTYERDPAANFHRLEGESLHGAFYSAAYSGGTGWVEMELFTGVPGLLLSGGEANTELEEGAYAALPSLPRVLKENGYRTIAFHAHTSELYNRERNYPLLGFDQVLFSDSLPPTATQAGKHFSDDSAADMIISLFEENREQGPLFLYTMTMENHQPYYAGRYDQEAMAVESGRLDREGLEILTCLTTGIYDADQSLGKLADYFSQVEEPVLLVFSGDHKPGLSAGAGSVYSQLGYYTADRSSDWTTEDYRRAFSTDYLIWSNAGGVEPGERPVSCAGMGALVLDLAGVDSTPFFSWQLRTGSRVWTHWGERLFVDGAGQALPEPTAEAEPFLAGLRDVVYDMLYGEDYLAGRANRVERQP